MKKRFSGAAALLLTVVVSVAASAAPVSRNSESRFESPRDVSERIVRILKNIGKKLIPVSHDDNITPPKP